MARVLVDHQHSFFDKGPRRTGTMRFRRRFGAAGVGRTTRDASVRQQSKGRVSCAAKRKNTVLPAIPSQQSLDDLASCVDDLTNEFRFQSRHPRFRRLLSPRCNEAVGAETRKLWPNVASGNRIDEARLRLESFLNSVFAAAQAAGNEVIAEVASHGVDFPATPIAVFGRIAARL
jgi:hypothetical protein